MRVFVKRYRMLSAELGSAYQIWHNTRFEVLQRNYILESLKPLRFIKVLIFYLMFCTVYFRLRVFLRLDAKMQFINRQQLPVSLTAIPKTVHIQLSKQSDT